MFHTKPFGVYHALWGGLMLSFPFSIFWTFITGDKILGPLPTDVPGAVWSVILYALVSLLAVPLGVGSFVLMREFTPRKIMAASIMIAGALILMSIASGYDLMLMTSGRFLPLAFYSLVYYFKHLALWTALVGAFFLAAFWISALAVIAWRKLAGLPAHTPDDED